MAVMRATSGRLGEVFFGIGYECSASVCTWSHPIAWTLDREIPRDPPHLHVKLRVWSKGGHATTILDLSGKRMSEDMTFEWGSRAKPARWVLEPSGAPIDLEFTVQPLPQASLRYSAGDSVPIDLRMSRGWTKKADVKVVSEQPDS